MEVLGMGSIRAVAAGHICIDITPPFPEGGEAADYLRPGSLVRVGAADIHSGGAVANVGLAMRRFGLDADLMGKAGDDAFGRMLLDGLKAQGADKGMRVVQGETTSYSVVLAPPGKDRMFLHCPGANDSFRYEDVDFDSARGARVFHFGYPPLMAALYSDGGEAMAAILREAGRLGALTSLDLASVDETSPAGRVDWEAYLARVLPEVDFFAPSAEELAFMIDRRILRALRELGPHSDRGEAMELAGALATRALELGARFAMVKCGAEGFAYRGSSGEAFSSIRRHPGLNLDEWEGASGFEPCYKPRRLRSATGAGDATIAAFLAATARGERLPRAVSLASAAGAACVEETDALSGLPSLEGLAERVALGWEKAGRDAL
jgi:sugar/nucleoside kinase (ribokinase family)